MAGQAHIVRCGRRRIGTWLRAPLAFAVFAAPARGVPSSLQFRGAQAVPLGADGRPQARRDANGTATPEDVSQRLAPHGAASGAAAARVELRHLQEGLRGRPRGRRNGHHTALPDPKVAFGSHLDMSCMLLGAIGFQMVLFYLVNWPKESIQYYAYHIIGLAISIFTAVLVYDSIFDIVDYHLIEEHRLGKAIVAALVQLIAWFSIMQFSAACLSGAVPWMKKLPAPQALPEGEERAAVEAMWHQRKLNIKCWVGQLTHITGFASISFFGLVQQTAFFRQSFWSAALVVPIAFAATIVLYHGTDRVRCLVVTGGGGGGRVDHSHVLWDEESEDAENDVVALGLSFVTAQALQFWFLGTLPDAEGFVEPLTVTRGEMGRNCVCLLATALAMAGATFLLFRLSMGLSRAYHGHANLPTRLSLIAVNYSSMLFAWCLYFAVRAGVHYFARSRNTEGILARIVTALAVSAAAFLLIFLLDFLAAWQAPGSEMQQALAKVILAKALLIGNSWECCFTTAFQAITFRCGDYMMLANLGLAVCLCIIVIPAYWTYILPEVHTRWERMKSQKRANEVAMHKSWYHRSHTQ